MFDAYLARTRGSKAAWERSRQRIPGGVTSNVRYFPPYPIYMTRGEGARLWDVDGHEYIDYCQAFGPQIAGHGHPRVTGGHHRRARAQLGRRSSAHPRRSSSHCAERLTSLIPSAEMVRFTNSGTESTMHALRVARGLTGRSRIVKFEGHYHGVHDSVLFNLDGPLPQKATNDGIPESVAAVDDGRAVQRSRCHPASVCRTRRHRRGHRRAHRTGRDPAAADFLRLLRDLTTRAGALLIFDEVVVWPRVGLGGAQGLFGITPDLTALGKAIGGGLPLAALVGRREALMEVEPRSARGQRSGAYVFHGGTYNGTPAALAAGQAVLDLLQEPGALDRLFAAGQQLRDGLTRLFTGLDVDAQVIGSRCARRLLLHQRPHHVVA